MGICMIQVMRARVFVQRSKLWSVLIAADPISSIRQMKNRVNNYKSRARGSERDV